MAPFMIIQDLSRSNQLESGCSDCEDHVPHVVDTPDGLSFASYFSHLPVWFGCSPHPEAAALDAFLQLWTVSPTFTLLLKVLMKIKGDMPEAVFSDSPHLISDVLV